MRKAAFLDRDGVINEDTGYVHRWEDFKFIPGALAGMKRLQDLGFLLVVVTNQSGLARGYYTEHQYQLLNANLKQHLTEYGIILAGLYHCPHHIKGIVPKFAIECDCRKPAPGMILRASRELGLFLPQSLMFGDKYSDGEAAQAAGVGDSYYINSDKSKFKKATKLFKGQFESLEVCITHLFPKVQ